MSVQTKKRFKNLGKIFAGVLFAFLMFTNIKVALMDDAELASGDISVLGIELNLFEPAYAEGTYNSGTGYFTIGSCTTSCIGNGDYCWQCVSGFSNECSISNAYCASF